MRRLLLLFGSILVLSSAAQAQQGCKKGIPCDAGGCSTVDTACRADSSGSDVLPEQRTTPTIPDWAKYVGSIRGHTYYLIGCKKANQLSPEYRIYFKSEADAKTSGYKHSGEKGC